MKYELFRAIAKYLPRGGGQRAAAGAALWLAAMQPLAAEITHAVLDRQLPANSAVVPALQRDAAGRLLLVYQAVRAQDSEAELRCITRHTNGLLSSNVISGWECGYLAGLACAGTQAHVVVSRPGGGGVGYYRTGAVMVDLIISNDVLHALDATVFGSFLERPSWHGEIGIEAGVQPGTNYLQPGLLTRLQELAPPVVRFPGGTDVDYMDWTDMIDNAPGRANPARPVSVGHLGGVVSNRFGYDEYAALCAQLGSEMMIAVNFKAGLQASGSARTAAAQHAAGLVAYCNAATNAALPAHLTNWPMVRARNGHPEPYGVKYWQIGNETWAYKGGDYDFLLCAREYINEMRAADPTIKIILDAYGGSTFWNWFSVLGMGSRVDYLSQHNYTPWELRNDNLQKRGAGWSVDQLTAEDVWYAWVAVPGLNSAGESVLAGTAITEGRARGYKVAVTEWNWNGWWGVSGAPLDSHLARGLGAAGFLHALMRAGDVVRIGCQSMTVGKAWWISALGVSENAAFAPFFRVCGQAVQLYTAHHGSEVVAVATRGVPVYNQVFRMGDIPAAANVALLDMVATRSTTKVYAHIINRHFANDIPVRIDVSAYSVAPNAVVRVLTSDVVDGFWPSGPAIGTITASSVGVSGGRAVVTVPKRAVAVVEFVRQ